MPAELCQCQSGTHGHEPGKCPNPATEEGGMCKRCHDESLVGDVAVPLAEPPRRGSFRRSQTFGRLMWNPPTSAGAYLDKGTVCEEPPGQNTIWTAPLWLRPR
jgi:hypothetical protein